MSYLAWYLGVGAVMLAAMFTSNHRSKDRTSDRLSGILSFGLDRDKLWYRTRVIAVLLVIAGVLFAVWPVLLFIVAKQALSTTSATTVREKREFAVARSDLSEYVTIAEIERREQVIDPLGAAPELPFGHLHAAWQKFLEQVGSQDAIWTFSAHWTNAWGRAEQRVGYVVVRNGAIGPHFLTLSRPHDEA